MKMLSVDCGRDYTRVSILDVDYGSIDNVFIIDGNADEQLKEIVRIISTYKPNKLAMNTIGFWYGLLEGCVELAKEHGIEIDEHERTITYPEIFTTDISSKGRPVVESDDSEVTVSLSYLEELIRENERLKAKINE